MFLLWHPSLTAINLSYTFPILETSATALCGTTGRYSFWMFLKFHLFLNTNRSQQSWVIQKEGMVSNGWGWFRNLPWRGLNLVKLARDLTRPISPQMVVKSKGNGTLAISVKSVKSRLVKYYSIWPHRRLLQFAYKRTTGFKYLFFSPPLLREMIQFDENIF